MTKRMRSQIQAAEMDFLRRGAGVSLKGRVRSSVICELPGVELILCEEGSQLGCSRHVSLGGGHGSDQGLERLYRFTGLGTLQDSPVRAG